MDSIDSIYFKWYTLFCSHLDGFWFPLLVILSRSCQWISVDFTCIFANRSIFVRLSLTSIDLHWGLRFIMCLHWFQLNNCLCSPLTSIDFHRFYCVWVISITFHWFELISIDFSWIHLIYDDYHWWPLTFKHIHGLPWMFIDFLSCAFISILVQWFQSSWNNAHVSFPLISIDFHGFSLNSVDIIDLTFIDSHRSPLIFMGFPPSAR